MKDDADTPVSALATPPAREEPPSGVCVSVTSRIRRLVAPNPSAFTFTGTCTYIVGHGDVAIVDPGPDDDAHFNALSAATRGERISHVLVTHTHRDHSALAMRLVAATGAQLVGARPHAPRPGAPRGLDAAHDPTYAPHAVLADGERLELPGLTFEAIATPGHAANHLCFALQQENALFSGDHVMAWSTSVVAPPDGSMSDYMASLDKLRWRDEAVYWPGHGGAVRDPVRYVRGLATHRRQRESAILVRLAAGSATVAAIVEKVYAGLDPRLVGAARLSTLAHLEDLETRGIVARDNADEPVFRRL